MEAVMEAGTANGATAEENSAKAAGRKTLEQRIAEAEADLRRLQDEKRKRDQAARDANTKAVQRLLSGEGLLAMDVEAWRRALPAIRKALG